MDKILHTPRMLFDIGRLDGQTPTTMTPSSTPGFNVVCWQIGEA